MPEFSRTENDFLSHLTAVVEKNIANEQFGVSELADEMNMSRSNLLRKVKKETNLSVSQLIRQVRLSRSMALLQTTGFNVSEVAHQVGFSSTSYFIKCFREQYGYPPGEVGKGTAPVTETLSESQPVMPMPSPNRKVRRIAVVVFVTAIVVAAGMALYYAMPGARYAGLEKSIAVLPFKNDSNDSTNVYLINGLMESTLNNLQQIKDLKVISRTSAEKYRNTTRSIPEMARELNVNYFVEGSGQKIGDQIVLNIQLIEASTDRHLWSRQYRREVKDIFQLQQEIAKNIVEEIKAIITPEEVKRIEKNPTDNLVAYDFFLKGRDLLAKGDTKSLEASITFFKKAIEQDTEFALAYASAVVSYYYIDAFQTQQKYTPDIIDYADKALLYDPKLAESLIAKAMSYMQKKQADQAIPYLEKALEYNPNSILVINFLADFYCNYVPNTTKYLEYALKGVQLDAAAQDSSTTSYNYLRLGNALIQTGFIDESLLYIDKSLKYNPQNPFASYVRAYILFAKTKDGEHTKNLLIRELNKDTSRLDILQDVGKIYCLMRRYDSAYYYYSRFLRMRESRGLDIYKHESIHMAIVLYKTDHAKEADGLMEVYRQFAENDRSVYKNLVFAGYYANTGEKQKALDYMRRFTKEDNYQYWILLMRSDPVFDPIKDDPEFKKLMAVIETKFWDTHKAIRLTLEEKGLL